MIRLGLEGLSGLVLGCAIFLGGAAFEASAAGRTTNVSLPAPVEAAATGEYSKQPMGWAEFCRGNAKDCQVNPAEPETITLTSATWQLISRVNREINKSIEPITDIDQWNVVEKWNYPESGQGDCEDYALLKRKLLAEAGLPRRALLMTVVIDETGGGHAILTVRTDRGDYILDNKRNAILAWTATGYRFVKREGQAGTGWVAMTSQAPQIATAAP